MTGDLRDGRLGDGGDHLRPVADDPLPLDLGADHEAGDVGQEDEGHVERVAPPDEAGCLVGGVPEEDASLVLRVVGHDADRAPLEQPEADDELRCEERLHLEERLGVDETVDHGVHVVRPRLLRRHDVGGESPRRGRRQVGRRVVAPPLRQVREDGSRLGDGVGVVDRQVVTAPRDGGVHAGAAHLLQGRDLTDHHLGHAW
jgi:hypothetical protein